MIFAMRALAIVGVLVLAACGPVAYIGQVTLRADDEVEQARAVDAAKYSPYYWTRATQYLHMAREVAAHADFQGANKFGRLAEEAAVKAKAESLARQSEPAPPAKPELAPAKDPNTVAPAKDGP
jgi:sRNA-binding protein